MNYNNIEMHGRLTAEIVNTLPQYTENYEGSIKYNREDYHLYYGNDIDHSFRSLVDIPKDSRIFFESNTAIIGYSITDTINDSILYITKGSYFGGEPGGTFKTDSTWTIPVHTHTQSHTHTGGGHNHTLASHTHTISAHNHQYVSYIEAGNTKSWNSGGTAIQVQSYGSIHGVGLIINVTENEADPVSTTGNKYTNDAASQETSASTDPTISVEYILDTPSSLNTGNDEYETSWRPRGRNFTCQVRL
jgi:hypothetical protein